MEQGLGKRKQRVYERYVDVIWRRIRTEKEALHADSVYAQLQEMRKIHPTTKTVGRVEPRPYASAALERCKPALVKAWKNALRPGTSSKRPKPSRKADIWAY